MRRVGAAAMGLVLLAACGLVSGAAKKGSCDFRAAQDSTLRCETISDTDITRQATTIAALKALCSNGLGTFINGDCPKAGIVAGCQLGGNQSGAGEVTTNWYYNDADIDAGLHDVFTSADEVKTKQCDRGDAPSTLVMP